MTKFDLVVKWVKVTRGQDLNKLRWAGVPDATYQVSWNSACRFRRRRILKDFYHIWAWRPPWPCDQHHVIRIYFLVPESFHKKLVQIGTVVSEKILFEFLYVHDIGPMSRNALDFKCSHTFIYSIRCLLLLTFRSLAAIVSEKSTVFTFSYRKS